MSYEVWRLCTKGEMVQNVNINRRYYELQNPCAFMNVLP